MRVLTTTALAIATAAALALAPVAAASATAAPKHPSVKHTHHVAAITVSSLSIIGHQKIYNVADKAAVVKVRVQVKDRSKKFDPASVTLTITDKATGQPTTTIVIAAHRVGKSKVVTNWLAKLTVPQGSVAAGTTAVYCVSLVNVDPTTAAAVPTATSAKGLAGRDCFTVVNQASTPKPTHPKHA